MIKFNDQSERKQKMGCWLIKLLSRDIKTKTKNKDQPTNKYKNNRKKSNGKYNNYYGPLS